MPKTTEFSLLFEVSQTLDSSLDLRDILGPVLKIIARHKGILRGSLTLLNRDTGEISIEAAYGLSASQQRKGRYRHRGRGHRPGVPDGPAGGHPARLRGAALPQPHRGHRPGRGQRHLLSQRAHQAGKPRGGRPVHRRALPGGDLAAGRGAPAFDRRFHDQPGGEAAAEGPGGAPPADRGEPAAHRGAQGPLPALQPDRQLQRHAGGLRPDRPGFRQRRHRAHPRGERHGQGAGGPRHPLQQPPGRKAVHQGELRRASGDGDRKRAVRAREGGLHGGRFGPQGAIRAGRRRHAVPGRGRATCPRACRSSSCACCRSASSSGSAAPAP